MDDKYVNDFEIKPEDYETLDWKAANGFCFDQENRVAIVWEEEKGYWCLPGGGKENSETPEQTFVREVVEETQCEPYDIKYFHCVYEKTEKKICFRFICKLKNIEEFVPRKGNVEIDERRFVNLGELPNYITWLRDTPNGRDSFEILKKKITS
jgi:8-oxo-dGTP pyrophosphatase MutT (NUDIX family)